MENETKQTNTNEQEPDIFAQKLREADSLYAILSGCTKEPYVYCDPETMDDAILLFTDEEGAKAGAQKLAEQQIPVGIAKVDRKSLLLFYTSLYTMGVNAIQVHVGEKQKMIQLTEFVRRKDPEESKNGKVWVENPELHLTMLYYMQDLRRQPNQEITPELNDLQEEIGAHFTKGRYIVPLPEEGNGIPLVKLKSGDIFQPIFTDVIEFQRFNREKKFRPVVVDALKLAQVLPEEAIISGWTPNSCMNSLTRSPRNFP